jgi:serine protease AprX
MRINWGALRLRSILLALSVLALIAGSFSPLFAASATDNGQTISISQEGEWYENWPGDADRNKIHDALEYFLTDSDIDPEEHVRVVADFDHKPTRSDELRMITSGWNILHVSAYLDSIVLTLPSKSLDDLASWKDIVMIEHAPDGEFTLSSALPSINVPRVWDELGVYGEGVVVAVIDTGVDDEHVGLDDMDDNPTTDDPKVIAFYDAQSHPNQDDGTYEPYDNHGHGTHCSGIVAGTGANNYQHIGVAPKAKLVGIKIGGSSIPMDAAMRGVEWAIDNKDKFGIDILSNSWGLYFGGPANQNGNSAISRLMDEAVEAGLVVFVAAGNTAISMTVYAPADSERAMAVGSVNDNHVLSYFSSQGPTADGRIKPDIAAIGEGVTSPNANSGGGYGGFSGTSAACPMAAGLGALVLSANPDLEPDDVKQIFHETSEHNTDARFPVSPNNGYGWGVVHGYGSVKRARDLSQTFLDAPTVVHEGDTIAFSTNTTYTRTEFTYKGEDGMRILGDDEVYFRISVPLNWSTPVNITLASSGPMDYDPIFQLPRIEDNYWIIEAEFHYTEDVNASTEATPVVTFESITPEVSKDTTYTLYSNITINGINATKVARNITVDNQDPPVVFIDTPQDGEIVGGVVSITGTAFDPDMDDYVESVEVEINGGGWTPANGTTAWEFWWDTLPHTNGQYLISVRAYDGEEYSAIFNITVNLDNFNLQPTALIDVISPNPANEGEVVSLSGYGTDDDGFIIDYEWKSTIDGFLSNATSFSTSALSVGVHTISFRVKDEDGVWSQKAEASLRINQIPLAHIDSIAPNPADEGEWVSFAGHGNDDGAVVAYNWRSDLDGALSSSASFSIGTMTTGDHVIYFRVQDDDGVWSSEVSSNLRINQIPLSFIDTISPDPADQGGGRRQYHSL